MAIVISPTLSLADTVPSGGGTITADNPVIGYEQLVTAANISATSAEAAYPVSNLANVSTNIRWQATSIAEQYITMALNTVEQVDYVAIAKHNFGSGQIPVSLEILDDSGSPTAWIEVVTDFLPADDSPIIMRFTPQAVTSMRIRLQAGDVIPRAAVVYAGKLLVCQRRIYVGHTPITMGRSASIVNGRSEGGDFLGRIVLAETCNTSFEMQNMTPDWFRTYMLPWINDAVENPFFFAWRPDTYPREVGFAWLTNDPRPTNQSANGMMSCAFEMEGVV